MKFPLYLFISASLFVTLACSSGSNNKTVENQAPATPFKLPAQSTAETSSSTSAPALNPEHGQPGHRCDIPVGSPLNAPVQSAAPALPNPSAAPNLTLPVSAAPADGPLATAINPPHGQPGHDCAIPVGAPLKK